MYIFYCHLCNDVFQSEKTDPVCNWCHSEVVERVNINSSDNINSDQLLEFDQSNFEDLEIKKDDQESDSVSLVSNSSSLSCKVAVAESGAELPLPKIKKKKRSRQNKRETDLKDVNIQNEAQSQNSIKSLNNNETKFENIENNNTVIVGNVTVSLADSITPLNSLSTENSTASTIHSSFPSQQNTRNVRNQNQNFSRENRSSVPFFKKLNKIFRKGNKMETVSIKAINYSERDSCSVCLDLFKSTQHVRITQCGHYFHSSCLSKCLKLKTSCPNCRSEFVLSNAFENLM